MIHFPRDLYVDIPGHGKDKINAAYAYGREPLLVQTMENLLKIRIHHVAKTNFEGFKNMTDAVGGVRVYAEEASNGTGNGGPVVIKKGWNDLDGEQALAFVRERYTLSEGDISRGRRQLAFIKALMMKAISKETVTNPVKIAKFTDAATKNLVLDQHLSISQLRDYAVSLRNIRADDVVFATAPFSGFGTTSARCVDRRRRQEGHGRPRRGAAHRHDGRLRRRVRHALSRSFDPAPAPGRRPPGHSTRLSSADTCDCRGWPDRGHVHDPEQVAVDVAVHPVAGGVLLGRGAAHDAVGAQLDLGRLGDPGVHLDEPGRVGEQQLDVGAVGLVGHRPPEAELGGERAHLVAVGVEQPGA